MDMSAVGEVSETVVWEGGFARVSRILFEVTPFQRLNSKENVKKIIKNSNIWSEDDVFLSNVEKLYIDRYLKKLLFIFVFRAMTRHVR